MHLHWHFQGTEAVKWRRTGMALRRLYRLAFSKNLF